MRDVIQKTSQAPIQIGVVDWRLPVTGADAVRFCATNNIKYLQIDFGGRDHSLSLSDPKEQDILVACCASYEVNVTAIAGNQLNDIGLGAKLDKEDTIAMQRLIVSILDVAVLLSVPLVFLPSFHKGIIRDKDTLLRTAGILRFACHEAKDRNLILGNENDLAIINANYLFETVGCENFCYIFDCYNPVKIGLSTDELIMQIGNRFASQVHIKDGYLNKDNYVALGHGDGHVAETLEALNREKLGSLYFIENDYRDGNIQHLKEDLLWLNKYLPIADDQIKIT